MSVEYCLKHTKVSGTITRKENDQLLAIAQQLGVSKSSLVSTAISKWLEQQKQAREGSR